MFSYNILRVGNDTFDRKMLSSGIVWLSNLIQEKYSRSVK